MQIIVRDNNVEQALRALKKKLQREGVYREMKLRRHYEKPSEKRARERAAAIRRARKLERKRMEREGAAARPVFRSRLVRSPIHVASRTRRRGRGVASCGSAFLVADRRGVALAWIGAGSLRGETTRERPSVPHHRSRHRARDQGRRRRAHRL